MSSTCPSSRGWSSSTHCTGSGATRRRTWPCAGTARPPSAARAAPRSTAAHDSPARRASPTSNRTSRSPSSRCAPSPLIKDLVTDVSWNYEVNKTIEPFSPPADVPQEEWRWQQQDIERVQEFRKCIECFLCQDVCHVLRNHETRQPFMGPRYLVRAAGLELHPIDQGGPPAVPQGQRRDRLLQHHQVLHRGLPRAHQDHGQRDHPPQGARRRRVLRPHPVGLAQAARRRGIGVRPTRRAARAPERGRAPRPDAGLSIGPAVTMGPAYIVRTDGAAQQSRTGLGRCCSVPGRSAGRARSLRGTGCLDLGLPRHPDEQRRRVHGRRPRARARPRARRQRGPPAPRFEAHRRAALRQVAGQGRQAHPPVGRRPTGPARVLALDGDARAARSEQRRGCARQRSHRPGHGGRRHVGRATPGMTEVGPWLRAHWQLIAAPALTIRDHRGGDALPPAQSDGLRPVPHRQPGRGDRGRRVRPDIDPTDFTTTIDNPYLPLTPGATRTYQAATNGSK